MMKLITFVCALVMTGPAFAAAGAACMKAKTESACTAAAGCSWDTAKKKCAKGQEQAKEVVEKETKKATENSAKAQKPAEEALAAGNDWEMDMPAEEEGVAETWEEAPVDSEDE